MRPRTTACAPAASPRTSEGWSCHMAAGLPDWALLNWPSDHRALGLPLKGLRSGTILLAALSWG